VTVFALVRGGSTDELSRSTPVEPVGSVAPARPERQVALSRAERQAALAVAGRFIRTAVARERVAESWALVHPQLRQGMTRSEWGTGEIPVQPYPVDAARWRLGYSTSRAVGFEVLLQPRDGSGIQAMMFDLELMPVGAGEKRHWLVSSWAPRAGGIAQQPPPPSPAAQAAQAEAVAEVDDHVLGAVWLIAPLGVFVGTLLLLPLVLFARDWRRRRIGERLHREHQSARGRS
jgi:hypothetical protein